MAGYSTTPLAKKLGFRDDVPIHLVRPPENYEDLVESLPFQYRFETLDAVDLPQGVQFVHLFVAQEEVLAEELPSVVPKLAKDGVLWISWPKKSARKTFPKPTDLDGGIVRRLGLEAGLVDVKVCAVDDTWSGHKFVYRLADR